MATTTKTKKHKRKNPRKDRNDERIETQDFGAIVERVEGVKKLKLNSPSWYQHQINKYKVGEKISLYLSNWKPRRSEQQNRYMWGAYYPLIMKEGFGAGNLEATHEDFARRHLTIKEWKNSKGQLCYIRKSTADLSKHEFSEYLESIFADTGIAPPPTDNFIGL